MMSFHLRVMVATALIFGLSGCLKAVEKVAVPEAQPVRPVISEAFDPDIPVEFMARLLGIAPEDPQVPELFLAVAAHFERQGEAQQAFRFLDRAADLFAARRDAAGEAAALSRKARMLMQTGRENEAASLIAAYAVRWPTPPLNAFPDYLAGSLALGRGDLGAARDRLRAALDDNPRFESDRRLLELRRDTELAAGIAAVLTEALPWLRAIHGGPDRESTDAAAPSAGEGRERLQKALALNQGLRPIPDTTAAPAADFLRIEADAETFLGLDEASRGNPGPAAAHLERAVTAAGAAGYREGEIRGLLLQAEIGLASGALEEGRQAAVAMRERADRYAAAAYQRWASLLLARYARLQGRNQEAISLLVEAAAIPRDRTAEPEVLMLVGLEAPQQRAIDALLVELLADQGRAAESFSAAERAKMNALDDLLAGRDLGGTEEEQGLVRLGGEIGATLRLLRREILAVGEEGPTAALLEKLRRTEAERRDWLARVQNGDGRFSPALPGRPLDPEALQRRLDQDTTLFAYYVTDRNVYVWSVQRQLVHLERLAVSREELRRLVSQFREAIRARDRRRTEGLSRRLYDLLLQPVIQFVSGERIGFVPDDCLRYLPFAALNYRGRYLIEGFSLFQLTAADRFDPAATVKPAAELKILAFGDPVLEDETLDLKLAVPEIETIRKRIGGTTVLTGQAATEAGIEQVLSGYDVVHFAVRGQFDPQEPLHSGLLLTPGGGRDGTLDILDVFRLHFPGRAVVLSGCDPQPEADPQGRGLALLQQGFLQAGSRSVVATLWLVEDRGATRLLDLFYRQFTRRDSPADALRTAQLQLLHEGQPAQVWAAFSVTGRY